MSELAKLLIRYGVDVTDIDKAEGQIKHSMNRVGNHALSIGKTIASAAGLGSLIYVGANVAKSFLSFEDAMTKVKVVSGATAEEFEKLSTLAREMGKTTEFSADQVANAMYELSSAGLSAADQASVLPQVLNLATAGSMELSDAAETVMKTLSGFGLAGTEAGHVTDVLAMSVNKSMLHFEDLALSMKYIAPIAGATNQSLEDMTAALAIMSNAGIRGEQAGTTLRGALVRLVDPTKEVLEGMELLGITTADINPSTHKLSEIISILADETKGLTDAEKNEALAKLFGTEALSGMLALVNKGPAALNDLSASFLNSGNAAKTSAEQMREATGKQLEILKNKLMDVGYTVIEDAMPAIEEFINKIMQLADSGKLEEWASSFGTILSDAVDLFGKLIGVVDWVTDTFGGLESALYGVAAAYATIKLTSWVGALQTAGTAAAGAASAGGAGAAGAAGAGMMAQAAQPMYAFGGSGAMGAMVPTAVGFAAVGVAAGAAAIVLNNMANELERLRAIEAAAHEQATEVIGTNQITSAKEAALAYQNLTGSLDESSQKYQDYKAALIEAGVAEETAAQAAALAASGREEGLYAINAEYQKVLAAIGTEQDPVALADLKRRLEELRTIMGAAGKEVILSTDQISDAVNNAVANLAGVPQEVTRALSSTNEEFYLIGVNGMGAYVEGMMLNIGVPSVEAAALAQQVKEALSSNDPEIRKNAAQAVQDMANAMAEKGTITWEQANAIGRAIETGLTISTQPSVGVGTEMDRIIAALGDRKASLDERIREINASLALIGAGGGGGGGEGGDPPPVDGGVDGNPETPWAAGGIVTRRTRSLLGEKGIETVLPLSNPSRTLSLMAQSLQIMGLGSSGRASGLSSSAGGGSDIANSVVVNVNVGTVIGDDRSLEGLVRKIKYEIEPVIERAMGGK